MRRKNGAPQTQMVNVAIVDQMFELLLFRVCWKGTVQGAKIFIASTYKSDNFSEIIKYAGWNISKYSIMDFVQVSFFRCFSFFGIVYDLSSIFESSNVWVHFFIQGTIQLLAQ